MENQVIKVGETVRINANLDHKNRYFIGVVEPMEQYRGQLVTIKSCNQDNGYHMVEIPFLWSADTFKPYRDWKTKGD